MKKKFCDLHIHSKYSPDGELEIEDILKKATEKDLSGIAITDHNTTEGTFKAEAKGGELGLDTITGVEVSTRGGDRENIHLLLYNIEKNNDLENDLNRVRTQYLELTEMRIKQLRNLGFSVTIDDVRNAPNQVPSLGPTLGEAVLANPENRKDPRLKVYLEGEKQRDSGYKFYLDFLKYEDSPAYVDFEEYSVYEAIELGTKKGYPSVLAHPGYSLRKYSEEKTEDFILDLIENGLNGIEVFSSRHDKKTTEFFLKIAEDNDLLITGGSDFHGPKTKPSIELNQEQIDYRYFKKLKNFNPRA